MSEVDASSEERPYQLLHQIIERSFNEIRKLKE
jgi:hypothetical protein